MKRHNHTSQSKRARSRNDIPRSQHQGAPRQATPAHYAKKQDRPIRSARTFDRTGTSRTRSFPVKLFTIVIGVLILLILITVGIQSCSEKTYDWNNLRTSDGRITYYENDTLASLTGIDVSSHQETIDWNQVAADGIDFAILRCGRRGYSEGGIYPDETFQANLQNATQAGLPVGVYFFSQAINEQEAREEADFVLNGIKGSNIRGPIAYDFEIPSDTESRAKDLSAEQATKNAEAFCSRIKSAGYTPVVYGNQHDLERYNLHSLNYPIWYAEYNSRPTDDVVPAIWQYTATGQVAGISTAVDINILLDTSLIR